jgi:hypothetical protein
MAACRLLANLLVQVLQARQSRRQARKVRGGTSSGRRCGVQEEGKLAAPAQSA